MFFFQDNLRYESELEEKFEYMSSDGLDLAL